MKQKPYPDALMVRSKADVDAFKNNWVLLLRHFAIDSSRAGWDCDLALSLARREYPESFDGETVRLSAVIDDLRLGQGPVFGLGLALRIAIAKIPAFQPPSSAPTRYTDDELADIARWSWFLRHCGVRSARDQAKTLLDGGKLRLYVLDAADRVRLQAIFEGKGNCSAHDGVEVRPRTTPDTLRRLIADLWACRTTTRPERLTAVQAQFIANVLPGVRMLHEHDTVDRVAAKKPGATHH